MRKSLIILFVFCLHFINAQEFSIGSDPGSLKWRYVKTKHFKVIYPEESEELAKIYAIKLEKFYPSNLYSMEGKLSNFPVVLHPYSSTSNGFYTLLPRRIEIYPTAFQGVWGPDWVEMLSVHEMRHAMQYENMNVGVTRFLGFLFGDYALALNSIMGVPDWINEGDAVFAETALTDMGRGRDPGFGMQFRAFLVSKGLQNYESTFLGSYDSYVPNKYITGYFYVAMLKNIYGDGVISGKLKKIGNLPFHPNYFALRGYSMGYNYIYNAKVSLYDYILADDVNRVYVEYMPLNITEDHALNSIIALKAYEGKIFGVQKQYSSLSGIGYFENGRFTQIVELGIQADSKFSVGQGKLAWTEEIADIRWKSLSYSSIVLYDMKSGRKNLLGKKSRYFSPAIHPSEEQIAIVSADLSRNYFLEIIDFNGKIIKKESFPGITYFQNLTWTPDGKNLVFVSMSSQGKGLQMYNFEKNKLFTLVPARFFEIANPCTTPSGVFFTMQHNDINDIFYVPYSEGSEPEQITLSRFGAAYSAQINDSLFFCNYSESGYYLAAIGLGNEKTLNDNGYKRNIIDTFLLEKLQKPNTEINYDDLANLKSKKYNRLLHSVNFHSWSFISAEKSQNAGNKSFLQFPVLDLYSTNILGNTNMEVKYNPYENLWGFSLIYTGLYPEFSTSYQEYFNGTKSINGTLSLQLSKKNGTFKYSFQPTIGLEYSFINDSYRGYDDAFKYSSGVNFKIEKDKSYSQYYSSQSFEIDIVNSKAFTSNVSSYDYFTTQLKFALPLAKTGVHRFVFGYQKSNSYYANVPLTESPIGLTNFVSLKFNRENIFPFNYKNFNMLYELHHPLGNLDANILNMIYIKRMSGSIVNTIGWSDYYLANKMDLTNKGLGAILYFDLHILRFEPEIRVGVGYLRNFVNNTDYMLSYIK